MKVSPKYQVVIPEQVRQTLNIRPGMEVDVIAKGGIAYIVPVPTVTSLRDKVKDYLSASDKKTLREKKDRKF
ncbi:MAG: AbrB/MazE/SpoVT family DNA-binding domain-containing protein [Bdellovibrionales bacterium]